MTNLLLDIACFVGCVITVTSAIVALVVAYKTDKRIDDLNLAHNQNMSVLLVHIAELESKIKQLEK